MLVEFWHQYGLGLLLNPGISNMQVAEHLVSLTSDYFSTSLAEQKIYY